MFITLIYIGNIDIYQQYNIRMKQMLFLAIQTYVCPRYSY